MGAKLFLAECKDGDAVHPKFGDPNGFKCVTDKTSRKNCRMRVIP
jgi:hypothetical protein